MRSIPTYRRSRNEIGSKENEPGCQNGCGIQAAGAAEGAFSNYVPGAYGTLLPGVAPEPGTVLQSVNLFYSGDTSFAVRQGQVGLLSGTHGTDDLGADTPGPLAK